METFIAVTFDDGSVRLINLLLVQEYEISPDGEFTYWFDTTDGVPQTGYVSEAIVGHLMPTKEFVYKITTPEELESQAEVEEGK